MVRELTWMETLNEGPTYMQPADHIASNNNRRTNKPQKKINLIPSSKVALRIYDTSPATTRPTFEKQLRDSAIVQRTHKHHGRTPTNDDHWKAHQGAMQKPDSPSRNRTTHQSLPMGDVYHKIDPSHPQHAGRAAKPNRDTNSVPLPCTTREMEDFCALRLTFLQDNHSTCLQNWPIRQSTDYTATSTTLDTPLSKSAIRFQRTRIPKTASTSKHA
jgi:hypothetical protein